MFQERPSSLTLDWAVRSGYLLFICAPLSRVRGYRLLQQPLEELGCELIGDLVQLSPRRVADKRIRFSNWYSPYLDLHSAYLEISGVGAMPFQVWYAKTRHPRLPHKFATDLSRAFAQVKAGEATVYQIIAWEFDRLAACAREKHRAEERAEIISCDFGSPAIRKA